MSDYQCQLCNFQSKIRSHYLNHLLTKKHLLNLQNSNIYTNKYPNKDNFCCSFCQKNFTRKYNLERHYISCKLIINKQINTDIETSNITFSTHNNNNSDQKEKILFEKEKILLEKEKELFEKEKKIFELEKQKLFNLKEVDEDKSESPQIPHSFPTDSCSKCFLCQYCLCTYQTQKGLNRHLYNCSKKNNEIEKIKNIKEIENINNVKEIEKLEAINQEKDKTIEIAKQTNVVNITNNSNKTINYLNTHFGDMIAMEQFLYNLQHNEKLTLKECENLLLSYKENNIDVFARNFSYIMKQNCKRQLAKKGLDDMKLIPLFCSDGNLRSHKEKNQDGWKTYYNNTSINKMLNISNIQVYESYQEIIPITGKERTRIYKEIKKDNHQNKFLKLINNDYPK